MLACLRETFTVYKTPKLVRIPSRFLAITYLLLVVIVWVCYLGSYELDLRKIYQKTCKVSGSILTKTKGTVSTVDIPDGILRVPQPDLYQRVWDNSDLVFLSHGGLGGFFLATNLLITPNQTRSKCPESSKIQLAQCKEDKDCTKGEFSRSGHGVFTGVCLNATGTCEIDAWCPVENDSLPFNGAKALLEDTKHFTVMIKNSVEFPDCGSNYKRRNILRNSSIEYLSNCTFGRDNDKTCPIFKIGDIVEWSKENFSEVAITGGVFQVDIKWTCDFDWGSTIDDCFPTYSFSRVDAHTPGDEVQISPGWNFRVADTEGSTSRTLIKYYGLKFLITVSGEGKCFDFLTLVLTIGATIGFFAVAPLVCDTLLDVFSKLKKCHPFHLCFASYSAGARIDGHKSGDKNSLELYSSRSTIATVDTNVDTSRDTIPTGPRQK